jgi:hypothetical protein
MLMLIKRLAHRWKYHHWPAVTEDMRKQGLTWARFGDEFHPVCDFCGGNCGQCGNTGKVGNVPASMSRMAQSLGVR